MIKMAKGMWRTLTGRKSGKSYVSREWAMARAKKYRKLAPTQKFRISPNWDKSKYAVQVREIWK